MSESPNDTRDPDPPVIPADVERHFGLTGQAWAERLRAAHAAPSLGRLGNYEILAEVGRGGQGEVYKAVQPGTQRIIALKRVAGLGLAPNAASLERFTREVDALARVSHPNIVSVYALEVIDGHSLLVMEFVDGTSVDRWSDRRWASDAQPLQSVLRAFVGICEGVSHAHRRGVIHRDIKPSNILVDADGRPRVLDFGIARLLDEEAAAGGNPAWTVTGFAGTPAYAAPEQLRPGLEGIDTRVDVYSLGVLLFRVLTGRELFEPGQGIVSVLEQVGKGVTRPPSRVRPGLPVECDWIVRKCTDIDPDRRYQSVDGLSDDIRRVLDGTPVLAHPPSAWYSLRRAISRRPGLSAGIAASILSVSSLGVVAAVQAIRLDAKSNALTLALEDARAQRDRAEREEQRQELLNRRLLQATTGAVNRDAFIDGADPSALSTLKTLVAGITPDDSDDTRAELHMRLGFAYAQAKRFGEAAEELRAALDISERIDLPSSPRTGFIVIERCHSLIRAGRFQEALDVADRAIARAENAPRTIHAAVIRWSRLVALENLGRSTDEIMACGREFVARCDEQPGRYSEQARAREEFAGVLLRRGELAAAELLNREALQIGRQHGIESRSMSRFHYECGMIAAKRGRLDEAEPFVRTAADMRAAIEGFSGPRAHAYVKSHGDLLLHLGRHAEAAARFQHSLVRPLNAARPDARAIAVLRFRLATAMYGAGDIAEARIELARALSQGKTSKPDAPEIAPLHERVEAALRASGWMIDPSMVAALGDLSWIAPPLEPVRIMPQSDPDDQSQPEG